MYENLCGNCVGRVEVTFHRRAILKVVKSMCNGMKQIKCTLMKCHTNTERSFNKINRVCFGAYAISWVAIGNTPTRFIF
jgi:hypothetical protein